MCTLGNSRIYAAANKSSLRSLLHYKRSIVSKQYNISFHGGGVTSDDGVYYKV